MAQSTTQRPGAVVVIEATNALLANRCLEHLKPTLGVRDRVIVVTDSAFSGDIDAFSALQRLTIESINDRADLVDKVLTLAKEEPRKPQICVWLTESAIPSGHWLDALLYPFANPAIGATSATQDNQTAEFTGELGDLKRFVRQWQHDHEQTFQFAQKMSSSAIALRLDATNLGPFLIKEEDHYSIDMTMRPWQGLVAESCYVFRTSDLSLKKNVLLSACLIMKDEEEALPECLQALTKAVDEIVIYDTGSSDNSVEVAKTFGARVIEGYWDDDFSRARNACLNECRGQWVFHVDADEVLEGAAADVRRAVTMNPDVDAMTVEIHNLMGDGTEVSYDHRGLRIFKRGRCYWEGALHEQVIRRPEIGGKLLVTHAVGFRLLHSGYLDEVMEKKDKLERNLRVAQGQLQTDAGDKVPGHAALNLGRTQAAIGKFEDALENYKKAAKVISEGPGLRMTLMHAAEACLAIERYEEALEWSDKLEEQSSDPSMPQFLRAQAFRHSGRHEEAIELLHQLKQVKTEDGYAYPEGSIQIELGGTLLDIGRHEEACDVMLEVLEKFSNPAFVAAAAEALGKAGRSMKDLAQVVPETGLLRIASALTVMKPLDSDQVAEELCKRFGPKPAVLASAIRFAPKLEPSLALKWSQRIRELGMEESCPLISAAKNEEMGGLHRLEAACLLWSVIQDVQGRDLIPQLCVSLADCEVEEGFEVLAKNAPDCLHLLISNASTTSGRCRLLALAAQKAGLVEVATALINHGAQMQSSAEVESEEPRKKLAQVGGSYADS